MYLKVTKVTKTGTNLEPIVQQWDSRKATFIYRLQADVDAVVSGANFFTWQGHLPKRKKKTLKANTQKRKRKKKMKIALVKPKPKPYKKRKDNSSNETQT